MTAYPIKQQEDTQKQTNTGQGFPPEEDWNHEQPTGPAAEAVMLYIGGARSHPIAMVDDRRVRPYGMSEGEGAHYAPDGSEQMVLFKDNGTYVVSLDGKSVKNSQGNSARMASLRHVNKQMQTHKIDSSQQSDQSSQPQAQQQATNGSSQQQKYKHEGDSINTEVRCTKDRIEFRAGDTVVGYYEASSQTWHLSGKIVSMQASQRFETVGKTYLGLDNANQDAPISETNGTPYKQTFVKLID